MLLPRPGRRPILGLRAEGRSGRGAVIAETMSKTISLSCWAPVSLDHAWDCWTSPAGLRRWWWPHLTDTTYQVDARVGGRYAISCPSAEIAVRGTLLAVERPQLLRMSWSWGEEPEQQEDLVEVRLTPVEDGVRVTVTHEVSRPAEVEDYVRGWTDVMDRFAQLR